MTRLLAFTGHPIHDRSIAEAHLWWHAATVGGELRQRHHYADPHPSPIGLDWAQCEELDRQFEAAMERKHQIERAR